MKAESANTLAISPGKAREIFDSTLAPEVRLAVQSLNSRLAAGTRIFSVSSLGSTEDCRIRVTREFESAGWTVKLTPDQRDGDYYTFSGGR